MARVVILAAVLGGARPVAAYCRRSACGGRAAVVCTPAQPDDCGVAARWPRGPLSYEIDRPDRDDRRALGDAVHRAFARWREVDCGASRHPDLEVVARHTGAAGAARGAGDPSAPGGAIDLSDDRPERGTGTLAITRLWFSPDRGEISRARVIFYTKQLQPYGPGEFLDSIALHEVGHFLGLAHSGDPEATMSEEVHDGSVARAVLGADDVAAVCAAFPPAPGAPHTGLALAIAAVLGLVAALFAWRRAGSTLAGRAPRGLQR